LRMSFVQLHLAGLRLPLGTGSEAAAFKLTGSFPAARGGGAALALALSLSCQCQCRHGGNLILKSLVLIVRALVRLGVSQGFASRRHPLGTAA